VSDEELAALDNLLPKLGTITYYALKRAVRARIELDILEAPQSISNRSGTCRCGLDIDMPTEDTVSNVEYADFDRIAKTFGVSRSRQYILGAQGLIHIVRTGGRSCVDIQALAAFLDDAVLVASEFVDRLAGQNQ
jgi:hypothetical protein